MRCTALTVAWLALWGLIAPTLVLAQGSASAPPPCVSEQHRQFDFWVGDWVVTTRDGQAAGTNLIEKTLNDCVITENWMGQGGSIGKSFNMYFSRDGRWHQTWVDGNGGRLDLTGGVVDGAMVLSGTMPGGDGGPVEHRISWTPLEDGTVRQHWRASRDGGASWQDLFVGIYTRREAGS